MSPELQLRLALLEKAKRDLAAKSGVDLGVLLSLANALEKRDRLSRIAMLLKLRECVNELLLADCFEI